MEALQHGPNPVVDHRASTASIIVRASSANPPRTTGHISKCRSKVQTPKSSSGNAGCRRTVQVVLESPLCLVDARSSLEAYSPVGSADPDPVESYPFREYDLTLLRKVMQELITQGRATERDYIQGRALLVLVRSLFTKFGWADAEEGALVTWDELFDLLVEETTYVPPLWVQEMLDNTLIPTFDGDEDAWEVCVSRRRCTC